MQNQQSKSAVFWARHLASIEREGLSAAAYARQHGLATKSIYYWRSKLARPRLPSSVAKPGSFIALRLPPTLPVESTCGCVLTLGAALKLELPTLPSTQWLASLAQNLRGDC